MNDKIHEYYTKIALEFTQLYGWEYTDKGVIDLFLRELKTKGVKQVFDLACGNGKVSNIIAQVGFPVRGIDFCENMLNIAQQEYSHPKIKYTLTDIRNLIFDSPESSAYVLLFSLIHWPILEQKEYLQKLVKMLKPGSLILFAAQIGEEDYLQSPIIKSTTVPVYCWDENKLVDMFNLIGLKINFCMKRTPWKTELNRNKFFAILEVDKNESSAD